MVVVLLALALGTLSAVLIPGLGHDAWAWMIWAREIAHLRLDTTTGATIKPLPMLLLAPFARAGGLAPVLWLTLVRAAFLLVPVAAWRLGRQLGGRLSGWFAAVAVALNPVLLDSAVNGYSEPLVTLCILLAATDVLDGRKGRALGLLVLAGLMRPEVWPFLLLAALWAARSDAMPALRAGLAAAFPALVWAALSWWGSGRPFGGATGTESIRGASGVFVPFLTGVGPLVAVGLLIATVLAVRVRNRSVLMLLGFSLSWVLLVALLVLIGFSGNSRYLVPAQAVAAVAAGWGLARAIGMLPAGSVRVGATGLVAVAFAGCALLPVPSARDSLTRFRANARIADQMQDAIKAAGGRDRVVAIGRPIVMNWSRRTALAWQLDVPITGTQVIWGRNWTGSLELPAILIASPPKRGNARSPMPTDIPLAALGRSGEWSVYLASRRPAGQGAGVQRR